MSFDIQAFLAEKFAQVEFYRDQMHPYQGTAYDFLKQNPYSALFCDMGLGKTVITLTALMIPQTAHSSSDTYIIILYS